MLVDGHLHTAPGLSSNRPQLCLCDMLVDGQTWSEFQAGHPVSL